MDNVNINRGALKSQKPGAGGAVLRQLPMIGVVKDNVDPTRAGRIRVYISALGGKDPNDEKNWTPVLYMSPFFGLTNGGAGNTDYGNYKYNPTSYGVWHSPPDVGTLVVCLFINGDPNFGFYIGSIPNAESLRMVPAIGANFSDIDEQVIFDKTEANSYGGASRLPVTNMNNNNKAVIKDVQYLTYPKPVHSFQASIMFQQGVLRDPIRGPISSSSQRETPSRVGWGVSTPGRPIYEGGFTDDNFISEANKGGTKNKFKVISRRGGHSIVMDDGDAIGKDNLIRIRTSLGHQILMSDDGQTLMLLHSNGQSYIELGKEGTVDVYSTNSINLRTHGDLNLHADHNININAKEKLNIKANEINIESKTNTNQKVGADYKIYTQGNHTHKVDSALSLSSSADASIASSATTFVNGSVINLNTGETSTVPEKIESITEILQTDTLFDKVKGWAAAPAKLATIVSRAPAHTPWANANQGVDVKVSLNADTEFPSSPNEEISKVNTVAESNSSPNTPTVTIPAAASVPPLQGASESLDASSTSALVGAVATQAQTGPAAAATQAGAGLVTTGQGTIAGIVAGSTALNAQNLQTGNIIKPGSAPLVDAIAKNTGDINKAMPSNLFTGVAGVTSLASFTNNVQAQATATVQNLQASQTALTKAGLLSGKESALGSGGVIMAGVVNGVSATVNQVKSLIGGGPGSTIAQRGGLASSNNGVFNSINSGNFAAGLSNKVMGGLSGISASLSGLSNDAKGILDKTKGVAQNAFASITASFKSFKPGVPQNPGAIVAANEAKANAPTNSSTNTRAIAGAIAGVTTTISNLGRRIASSGSNDASSAAGLNNLPGGLGAVNNIIKNNIPSVNSVPGVKEVSGLANNSSASALNNISLQSGIDSAKKVGTNILGSSSDTLKKLKSGTTDLKSVFSSGLSPAESAKLNTSIASISSGGSVPIKLPTIATDTVDRGALTATIGTLLPAGVPTPNFTGVSQGAQTALEASQKSQSENQKKLAELDAQYEEQKKLTDTAEAQYFEAKNAYPPGDPTIEAARSTWDNQRKKLSDISTQISQLVGVPSGVTGGLVQLGNQGNAVDKQLESFLRTPLPKSSTSTPPQNLG